MSASLAAAFSNRNGASTSSTIDDSTDGWLAVPLSAVQSIEQRSADNLRQMQEQSLRAAQPLVGLARLVEEREEVGAAIGEIGRAHV